MDFFDKLGKKASEAYKFTTDKTGKLAKEAKLKFKIGDLRNNIDDIYEEIGKIVYEKHIREEEISIKNDLEEQCTKIDFLSDEIETMLKECMTLNDTKKCGKCYSQMNKDSKFCPTCGEKQNEVEVKEAEIVEDVKEEPKENEEDKKDQEEYQENLVKTTEIEIGVEDKPEEE